jgi:uncharacterized membrane protein YfcA
MDLPFLLLGVGAFCAGLVDAVVGGGGLIQIPCSSPPFPKPAPPPCLAPTSCQRGGHGQRRDPVQPQGRDPWQIAAPAAIAAAIGSWFGARAVVLFPPAALRPLILVLLIAVAIYTFMRKDFGVQGRAWRRRPTHDPRPRDRRQSVSTTDSSAPAPAAF